MDLKISLNRILKNCSFSVAVLIAAPDHQPFYSLNSQQQFRSASLIKLAIAAYLNANFQSQILHKMIRINDHEIVGGSGILYHLQQRNWLVSDLIDLMLSVSDNTATNVLLDYFGIEKINDWLGSNYPEIELKRYMLTKPLKGENTLNLNSLMNLWQELLADKTSILKMIKLALQNQQNTFKLRADAHFNGFSGTIYNKTGELSQEEHDFARFCYGKRTIDCGVLTHFSQHSQRIQAVRLEQQIGSLLMKYLME